MEIQNNSGEISIHPAEKFVLNEIAKNPYVNEDNKGREHRFRGRYHGAKENLLRMNIIQGHSGFRFSLTDLGKKLFDQGSSFVGAV